MCPGACSSDDLLGFTVENWVKLILALDPQNQTIQEWLADLANGTANGPTPEDVSVAEHDADAGLFTFYPNILAGINTVLSWFNPMLPEIYADAGILAPYHPQELAWDFGEMLGINQTFAYLNTLLGL